jgi:hypothetical protein
MNRPNPKFNAKLREQAKKAYEREGTVRKAAAYLGLSPSRTYTLLKEAGVLPKEDQ